MGASVALPRMGEAEREVVLACAALRLGPAARRKLEELLDQPLDWAEVLDWAGYHHALPLLYHHLSQVGEGRMPEEALHQLRMRSLAITARSLKLTTELAQLSEELDAAGATPVVWKGPVLAHSVYPSPELRTFADLDIIIRRGDRARAREVLRRRGFRGSPAVTLSEDELFRGESQDATMWNEARRISVDVHWGTVPRYRASVADFELLWSRSEPMELHGSVIRVMEPGTHLLALCAHGAKHRPFPWPAAKWISDIDAFLHVFAPDAWIPLLERARRLGCHRMLLFGLLLARETVGARLPPPVEKDLSRESGLAELVPPVRDRLLHPERADFTLGDRIRFDLAVRERRRDRIGYRVDRLLTPSRRDRETVPPELRLLQVPLRLARLAGSYLLRPWRIRALFEGTGRGPEEER